MKFRHKSGRIPGLGIFGCSWSFEKVLFILKMKFQNAFCCSQKTQKCSSPFFLRTAFFLRMDCGLSSFFFKDGGGPRGPKKRGMHPPFLFFLWIASSGSLCQKMCSFFGPQEMQRIAANKVALGIVAMRRGWAVKVRTSEQIQGHTQKGKKHPRVDPAVHVALRLRQQRPK